MMEERLILDRFNKRETSAFTELYDELFREVFFYAHSLFKDSTIDPIDIAQDAFVELWEKRNTKFDSKKQLKSYIYVMIKNRCKVHYNHLKVEERVHSAITKGSAFITEAAEAELFSVLSYAIDLLPEECAKVMKLFLADYTVKEIAEITGKSEYTIYKQRQQGINILKHKLPKDKILLVLSYFIK